MLERLGGPPCPKCECPDSEIIGERKLFGLSLERRRCAFCGNVFSPQTEEAAQDLVSADDDDVAEKTESGRERAVGYNAAPPRCRCPACNAANPLVKSTTKDGPRTIRYHKCRCGVKFKSIEETA